MIESVMSQVRFALVMLLIAASATESGAQTAVVGGQVYRDSAQHLLDGAEITIQPANRVTRSNYLGEFDATGFSRAARPSRPANSASSSDGRSVRRIGSSADGPGTEGPTGRTLR